MSDLKLKFKFTDRGGYAVYDVVSEGSYSPVWDGAVGAYNYGQVRIPPDPRIKDRAALLKMLDEIAEANYGCESDWCGKSPSKGNANLCPQCEIRAILNRKGNDDE